MTLSVRIADAVGEKDDSGKFVRPAILARAPARAVSMVGHVGTLGLDEAAWKISARDVFLRARKGISRKLTGTMFSVCPLHSCGSTVWSAQWSCPISRPRTVTTELTHALPTHSTLQNPSILPPPRTGIPRKGSAGEILRATVMFCRTTRFCTVYGIPSFSLLLLCAAGSLFCGRQPLAGGQKARHLDGPRANSLDRIGLGGYDPQSVRM